MASSTLSRKKATKTPEPATPEELESFGLGDGIDVSKLEAPVQDSPAPAVEMLLKVAADWELFHCDDAAYFTAKVGDHLETHPLASRAAKLLLCRQFYGVTGRAPNPDAMTQAFLVLDSKARFDGRSEIVGTRIMFRDGAMWLDLCNDKWQAVRIDTVDWKIVDNPPVKFIHRRGMQPLPAPVNGGEIKELRPLLNAADDDNWILTTSWIVGAFMPTPPFPILAVSGEQGSAKSTLCRMIRRLIDPNAADLRSAPKDERDLMIAATNSRIVALDNVSTIPPSLSDGLCRLATGSGFGCRELYSDGEEKIFAGANPIILNGIGEAVERPDLAERSIFIHLPPVADSSRKTESELWEDFEKIRPGVLGAVLDAVVTALAGIAGVIVARQTLLTLAPITVVQTISAGQSNRELYSAAGSIPAIHLTASAAVVVAAGILQEDHPAAGEVDHYPVYPAEVAHPAGVGVVHPADSLGRLPLECRHPDIALHLPLAGPVRSSSPH